MGFITIPGSGNLAHVKDNLDISDFKLTKDDLENIAKLNNNQRRYTRTQDKLDNYQNYQPKYED